MASRPFPGVVEALDALAAAGARLAVCTNKRTDLSLALLDALDLTRRFAAVDRAGQGRRRQARPAPPDSRRSRPPAARPDRALMVGDATHRRRRGAWPRASRWSRSASATATFRRRAGRRCADRPLRRTARRSPAACSPPGRPLLGRSFPTRRTRSSAGEHSLHTRRVAGSIPAASTHFLPNPRLFPRKGGRGAQRRRSQPSRRRREEDCPRTIFFFQYAAASRLARTPMFHVKP